MQSLETVIILFQNHSRNGYELMEIIPFRDKHMLTYHYIKKIPMVFFNFNGGDEGIGHPLSLMLQRDCAWPIRE